MGVIIGDHQNGAAIMISAGEHTINWFELCSAFAQQLDVTSIIDELGKNACCFAQGKQRTGRRHDQSLSH